MGTKIQINSLQALERLIGGDSEFEIEIRNSVVQEFAKKHLKTVVQNFSYKLDNDLKKIITETIIQTLGITYEGYDWHGRIKIPSEIINQIKYEVEKSIRETIAESTQETVGQFDIEKIVKHQVEVRVTDAIKKEVNDQVDKKLKEIRKNL